MRSTSAYGRAENVIVAAIVISELKLRDVKWHVFGTHFVERPHHATLEDRPETLNRVGVNRAIDALFHVFFTLVIDGVVRKFSQYVVALPFIGREQTDLVGYGLSHKFGYVLCGHSFQNARNNIALAAYGTDDWRLASASTAAHAVMALIPMAVVVLAANPRFVNLDDTAKLFLRLQHRGADFVAHRVRRFVRAEAHLPLHLKGRNSFLAGCHQMHNLEPLPKRLVGILKNCARDMGEAIALIRRALVALPLEGHRPHRKDFYRTSARANDAIGPSAGDQVSLAGVFVPGREHRLKLGFGHLVNRLRATGCHRSLSLDLRSTIISFSVPVKRQIIASQEARSGAERRRWFAAASTAVERRQASALRSARAASEDADHRKTCAWRRSASFLFVVCSPG